MYLIIVLSTPSKTERSARAPHCWATRPTPAFREVLLCGLGSSLMEQTNFSTHNKTKKTHFLQSPWKALGLGYNYMFPRTLSFCLPYLTHPFFTSLPIYLQFPPLLYLYSLSFLIRIYLQVVIIVIHLPKSFSLVFLELSLSTPSSHNGIGFMIRSLSFSVKSSSTATLFHSFHP